MTGVSNTIVKEESVSNRKLVKEVNKALNRELMALKESKKDTSGRKAIIDNIAELTKVRNELKTSKSQIKPELIAAVMMQLLTMGTIAILETDGPIKSKLTTYLPRGVQ